MQQKNDQEVIVDGKWAAELENGISFLPQPMIADLPTNFGQ